MLSEGLAMLCMNKCGLYGSRATRNLCSKCYQEFRVVESYTDSIAASLRKLRIRNVNDHVDGDYDCMVEKKPRCCSWCNEKIGLLGFACLCGGKFCDVHRPPDKHTCFFDDKALGRNALAEEPPLVVLDNLEKRI